MDKPATKECKCFKETNLLAESYDISEGAVIKCLLCGRRWHVGPIDKQTGHFSIRLLPE